MKKIIFSLLVAIAFSFVADAQQDAAYDMYLFNQLYINPAYAGSQDVLNVMGIYRNQWSGMDGAPRTVNASVDAPLRRDHYALGLTIMNDRLGLSNSFSATGAFAYRIRLKADNILALGVQAGATYYQARLAEASTSEIAGSYDKSFSINQNLWLPNVGAGIYAYGKRYFIGLSIPHMIPFSLSGKWSVAHAGDTSLAHQYNHIIFTAGYVFGKEASIVKFRPSILLDYQKGTNYGVPQISYDLGLLFVDRLWVIAGVSTGSTTVGGAAKPYSAEGIIGMLQFKVTPQLGLGYAYHYSFLLSSYETGTHEVMINYLFWYNKKRFVTPRYVKYF